MNPRRPLLIQYSKSVPHAHLAVLRSPSPAGKRRLAKRVPLDSFSLREKVAGGRMRVRGQMVFCNAHCLIAGLISGLNTVFQQSLGCFVTDDLTKDQSANLVFGGRRSE